MQILPPPIFETEKRSRETPICASWGRRAAGVDAMNPKNILREIRPDGRGDRFRRHAGALHARAMKLYDRAADGRPSTSGKRAQSAMGGLAWRGRF
jgi:hypothetical protein